MCDVCGYWAGVFDTIIDGHHPHCPKLVGDIFVTFPDAPTEMPPDPPGGVIDPDQPDPYWRGQIGA